MAVKRIRYIEREFIFKRIKNTSEYITDEMINNILDEHRDNWCDLTFVFDYRYGYTHTTIIDNYTGNNVNIADLNFNANQFYQLQVQELIDVNIQQIKNILHREKAVV